MKALGKLSLFDSVCKGSTNGNQRKSMSRVLAIYCVHCHIVLSMRRCIYKLCRWILARYDVDVLDYYDTKQAVVDSAPLNEGVDILEFDYSRKEVEVRIIP